MVKVLKTINEYLLVCLLSYNISGVKDYFFINNRFIDKCLATLIIANKKNVLNDHPLCVLFLNFWMLMFEVDSENQRVEL